MNAILAPIHHGRKLKELAKVAQIEAKQLAADMRISRSMLYNLFEKETIAPQYLASAAKLFRVSITIFNDLPQVISIKDAQKAISFLSTHIDYDTFVEMVNYSYHVPAKRD